MLHRHPRYLLLDHRLLGDRMAELLPLVRVLTSFSRCRSGQGRSPCSGLRRVKLSMVMQILNPSPFLPTRAVFGILASSKKISPVGAQ